MKIKIINFKLPEGTYSANAYIYSEEDDSAFSKMYKDWIALSTTLKNYGGRGVNLPEVLSEGVFCRATGCIRMKDNLPSANTSFDVYNIITSKRIQIKACSVLPDLTSFGPDSVWDELYFMDFYSNGKWDGTINIYKIPNELIYNHKVNASQTMREQQKQGRRPRFSIYSEIIQKKSLEPYMKYKI